MPQVDPALPSSAPDACVEVVVNGEPRSLARGCSVAELLEALGLGQRRLAVAVNRDIVPRSARAAQELRAGDAVEILEAVGGG